jgi:hypothetical protein
MAAAPSGVHAQATHRMELTLFAGAGGTVSLSHPGLDRTAGPTWVGGIELARPALSGLAGRLALRAEGGFASQEFKIDQDVLSGDVHTVHAALAVQLAFRDAEASRVVPYAFAGAAWGRPSSRFELNNDPQTTPGAGFTQVTHENVPGAIVGAGVAWRMPRVAVRAEARWMALRTAEGASSTLPLMVTIAVPLRR